MDLRTRLAVDEAVDHERLEHEHWKQELVAALARGEARLLGVRVGLTFPDGRPDWMTDDFLAGLV